MAISEQASQGISERVQVEAPVKYFDCGAAISGDAMERFVGSFEKSARRWEVIVYPALFAFVVLAGYGFYLVFSLTSDMHTMARSVQTMTTTISDMQLSMNDMTASVADMRLSVSDMNTTMHAMNDKFDPMLTHLKAMDQSMQVLTTSNEQMRRDMTLLSRNVSRPFSIMNSFMP